MQRRARFLKGVVVIASTAVLAAGTALAATGARPVPNLGQASTVNATSTLTGSSAKVKNLAAGSAGGQHALAAAPASSIVRMSTDLSDGRDAAWNVGPYFTFRANCYRQGNVRHLDEVILNNSPSFGGANAADILNSGRPFNNAFIHGIGIGSGRDDVVDTQESPSSSPYPAAESQTNIIYDDGSETVTINFVASPAPGYCYLRGTITRAT